jgi:hypothetical protein
MALVRINRNGTYYEMYHVANEMVERECSRLEGSGLQFQPNVHEPGTNSFTVMQYITNLAPHVEAQLVSVA